jgi:outer membrane protein
MQSSSKFSAAVALSLGFAALSSAPARADVWAKVDSVTENRLYLRGGGLWLRPMPSSKEVEMSNLEGPAELALPNGPIAGSGVSADSKTMLAGTLGYRVWRDLSVEAVLASPFTLNLTMTGTLAEMSVAPYALGNVPTGIQPFGETLGTTKVLPPIFTAVYRFPVHPRIRPYGGLGFSYVYAYDTKITNSVLTEVAEPDVSIDPDLAWVVQAGVDIKLWKRLYFTFDAKFVGGLDLVAEMNGLALSVPNLPIYGTVDAGTGTAEVTVNPLVLQGGVGWDF